MMEKYLSIRIIKEQPQRPKSENFEVIEPISEIKT